METVKALLKILAPILLVCLGLIALGWWLIAQGDFDTFRPTGVIAAQQRDLLLFSLGLSLIVVVPVFIMLWVFAWRFREGNKKARYRPEWDKNNLLEVIWWGIPILIIVVLGIVTWQTSHGLDPYRPIASSEKTLEVQVVALQWKWLFLYPELGVATVNKLPLPVDRPVHFTLAADAPMSAFWIPKLGSQIYSMNGMSSELNLMATKTGTFKGYNTNINGKGYSDMIFDAVVMDHDKFTEFTKKSQKAPSVLNENVYNVLAKPGIESTPKTYRLADKNLYDTIVMKYMHGMSSGSHAGSKHEHSGSEGEGEQK